MSGEGLPPHQPENEPPLGGAGEADAIPDPQAGDILFVGEGGAQVRVDAVKPGMSGNAIAHL